MAKFAGDVVIVSGGSRGMGESHVRAFVAAGAKVVIGDVLEIEGGALAAELGANAMFCKLDVSKEDDWADVVARAEEAFGPVTVLVNNAGILRGGLIEDSNPDDFRLILDVNLTGVYLGMRAVIASMRKAGGGTIINISSAGGLFGQSGAAAYCSSKWGVRGLTKTGALELGRYNIRVNSVHPGFIQTPMIPATADSSRFALPGTADPKVITDMVLFLASDESRFSTGSEFVADGGMSLAGGSTPN